MEISQLLELRKKIHPIAQLIIISSIILFICGSLRHALYQSTAWDLGIFDQAIYLISQGKTPYSTLIDFHILGDHGAFIFYPLAIFYKIHPSVHWLFAIQAISLSIGALPLWYLGLNAGLKETQAFAIAVVYLLYPVIFNVNLFDFHPDVIALPAIFGAILAARLNKVGWFIGAIILILSCKAALSLTVAGIGVWLLIFEKKRLYGIIAIIGGVIWFIVATEIIMPYFGGELATLSRHIPRYEHLGKDYEEMLKNLFLKPQVYLKSIFSLDNLWYVILLFAPIAWGLSSQHLAPLVAAIPVFAMNCLSILTAQKDLIHQYSLPILPFLLLAVISSLAAGKARLQTQKYIILWAVVCFVALAKFGYFWSRYLDNVDTWQATRHGVSLVKHTKGGVYTTASIVPHLSQREMIQFTEARVPPKNFDAFDSILLDIRHPGWQSNSEYAIDLVNQLNKDKQFKLSYEKDDVFLFSRIKK